MTAEAALDASAGYAPPGAVGDVLTMRGGAVLGLRFGGLTAASLPRGSLIRRANLHVAPHAAQVLVANTPMDTDKVKIYGSKVKVDSVAKVAEIEAVEARAAESDRAFAERHPACSMPRRA